MNEHVSHSQTSYASSQLHTEINKNNLCERGIFWGEIFAIIAIPYYNNEPHLRHISTT